MRDSYKRFVKTWIRFANPWIRTISWLRILTSKRFVSCLTKRILDSYRIVGHESSQFSKIRLFLRILRILSTIARNESLKIKIRESKSLWILKFCIRESGFANPNLKDSYRGFLSWIRFWKIRFVDSFREIFFSILLDSFRFVRIRIRIPHP